MTAVTAPPPADAHALDRDACFRAARSKDARFDGAFVIAVTTTGIYCRPSCPVKAPLGRNVRFYRSAAAAQQDGFRACKRCLPDAVPGSPEWDGRADVAARAVRLVDDGVVDREGVAGLARRLGTSERQLRRTLSAELGVGPDALARARRASAARSLLESTDEPITQVAFAAGFRSVRQFNETMRRVFDVAPSEIRRRARRRGPTIAPTADGELHLRLPHRPPLPFAALLGFLGTRCVPGVEEIADGSYRRVLHLPRGLGIATLAPGGTGPTGAWVDCRLRLDDPRDVTAAVQRCRRLLDLDADPVAVDAALGDEPLLAAAVAAQPGRRVPGHVDGHELAVRAVLGQQVSVAAARTLAARLAETHGEHLAAPVGTLTVAFPTADALAGANLGGLGLTGARQAALRTLAGALAAGDVQLDPGADRDEAEAGLQRLSGIGPWTAAYIRMRALGDPDVALATDLGVRRALERLGADGRPRAAAALAERWRPWRSYAVQHLWASLSLPAPTASPVPGRPIAGVPAGGEDGLDVRVPA
ncbi:MAG TPA: AlkA N-terminal domain-containing protein [Acidimicrobiales bacterium]|nr:AlkA N-terminal domain-containing protein [Acidimicrobiales bacterium]